MKIQNPKHVSRVRWKWIFGPTLLLYGAYSLVERWIFWRWGADWQIVDLLVEPAAVLLGVWISKEALRGAAERIKYGSVTVKVAPMPVVAGNSCEATVRLSRGMKAGEPLDITLECERLVPDSDGVERQRLWILKERVNAQAGNGVMAGTIAIGRFNVPRSDSKVEADGSYEQLTLHVDAPGGLKREFVLPR